MSETRDEPEYVCMVFSEYGNAVDAFPYTVEELEKRLAELRGYVVSVDPSPWVVPVTSGVA